MKLTGKRYDLNKMNEKKRLENQYLHLFLILMINEPFNEVRAKIFFINLWG